ncbi:MAG: F0F1 ATP synthase subunit delta [Planctomycetales bacterium]|nr:F0F1 ATP synthase subunit delta [Planctomycetales bacterium]
MSATLATFLFESANFLVLAAALGWLFFKPVRQALADHRNKFEADNRLAADKLAEATRMQQEIQTTKDALQLELQEFRTKEMELAQQKAQQIVAEARGQAEREREARRREAAQMSDTQRDTLAEVSAAAAADTVGRLLTQIGGPDLQSALINSACVQLREISSGEIAPVKIESKEPLSDDQIALLRSALGSSADATDFRVDEGLGDGVRITTGKGLIDASVRGLVQYASQSLIKEMGLRANHHNRLQHAGDDYST